METSKLIHLSVVIPAFNEELNFQRGVLDEVYNYLKTQTYLWEVILVNDGSTDRTLELLQKFTATHQGFKIVDIPHGGKVAAVKAGVEEARGEIVLFTDFDQSTPLTEAEKVLEQFEKGSDVVIAQRSGQNIDRPFLHILRSKIFSLLVQMIVLPGVTDSQCGFKAFKNNIGKQLFSELQVTQKTQQGGYMGAFDVELIFLARKHGFKINSIPVSWKAYESNKLSSSEPIKMLRDIVYVRFADWSFPGQEWKTHLIPLLLLVLFTLPAIRDIVRVGFFPMHDDLQVTRQLVMDKCFADGQIPCRWSEDLGYGYGYPLFNYYPPLSYYFGQIFHWSGLSFTDTVKALAIANFLVSGLTMYLLAQAFWGKRGGLISAIFFIYAPYHAVDVYARAAMNEAWAIAWFPGIFWASYRLISTKKKRYIPLLALFVSLLMLSHNPMLMIFAPLAIIWVVFWLIATKNFLEIIRLVLAGAWAIALAAFFTLPVVFEQKYVHVDSMIIGYFNYLAHFATVNQLFLSRFWGYGDSRFGPFDDISFQIGHLHWIFSLVALIIALKLARKKSNISLMILGIFGLTLFYTFMSHQNSSFIWSTISQLQYLQFPWRFLSISIFGTSFLAGSVIFLIHSLNQKEKIKTLIFISLIFGTIFFYKDYFHWRDHWPWVTDQIKFSGKLWQLQITAGIFDYLPIWAPLPPAQPPNGDAEVIEGQGNVEKISKNSVNQEYRVAMKSDGVFQINTFYFPGWRYFVNGKEVNVDPSQDKEVGRPRFNFPVGTYRVIAEFTNTPIRLIGNALSFIGWGILLVVLLRYIKTKNR